MEWMTVLLIVSILALARGPWSVEADEKTVRSAYFYYGSGMPAGQVNATLFTHVYYAFADMDATSFQVKPPADDGGAIATFSHTLKQINPKLKTLISIGGGGSNASAFAAMASSPASRAAFIHSSIKLARSYGFDGLDLDWESPWTASDMANFGVLVSEWKTAVKRENKRSRLLLTAAVYYNVTMRFDGHGTRSWPVDAISEYLDWVTVMSYDLHGSWEATKTAEHTALFDPSNDQTLSVNYGIQYWLAAGIPNKRISLGLAAYGYQWFLKNASDHVIGSPTIKADAARTYHEIMSSVVSYNGTCNNDYITVCAYCYWTLPSSGETLWAGFDDPTSISLKIRYLKRLHLRGYSFWSVAGDPNGVLFKQASRALKK